MTMYFIIFFVILVSSIEIFPKSYSDRAGALVFLPLVFNDYLMDYFVYAQTFIIVLSIIMFVGLLLKKKNISNYFKIIFLVISLVFFISEKLQWQFYNEVNLILILVFLIGLVYEGIYYFLKTNLNREKFAIVFFVLGGFLMLVSYLFEFLNGEYSTPLILLSFICFLIGVLPELIVGLYEIGEVETE